jgi:peptide-methionine (S)-S-oxide reductase
MPSERGRIVKRLAIGVGGCAVVAGLFVALMAQEGFSPPENFPAPDPAEVEATAPAAGDPLEVATFGSGCFWCSEAVFQRVKGVRSVVSGYSGGSVADPTYEQVSMTDTGHAEVVQVTFDPKVVTYPDLLEVFWRSHDPTTPNRQGNDVGPQYRSVVFYHTDRQRDLARRYKQKINEAGVFRRPVVTEIVPFTAFYPAEAEHQDYYARHRRQPYCQAMIAPKLDKLKKVFGDRLEE